MAEDLWERCSALFWPAYIYAFKIAQLLTFLAPRTFLIVSYPALTYFATLSRRYTEGIQLGLRVEAANHPNLFGLLLYAIILSPLIYWYLSQYRILGARGKNDQAGTSQASEEELPEDLFDADPNEGLSQDYVELSRRAFGINELKRPSAWSEFFADQLLKPNGSAVLAHMIAGTLALYFRDYSSAAFVLVLQSVFLSVGVYQKWQADSVVYSLAPDPSLKARVVRDGQRKVIDATSLVPGDIILLESGMTVPADCRIIKLIDTELHMDQSAITGDSSTVSKQRGDICYYTTGVKSGDAIARVHVAAPESFIGRTVTLIQGASGVRRIKKISRRGGQLQDHVSVLQSTGIVFAGLVLALVASVLTMSGYSSENPSFSILEFCVTLAIAALPLRLSISMTTIRATGAAALSEIHAVPQYLGAVDEFAGVDVLCADKTGTITQGEIHVEELYCLHGDERDLVTAAGLASPILISDRLDGVESVILQLAKDRGIDLQSYTCVEYKVSSGWIHDMEATSPSGKRVLCMRASPRVAFNRAGTDLDEEYKIKCTEFSDRGLSCMGVCRNKGDSDKDWELLGLIAMNDYPRNGTPESIRSATAMNISTKVVTGGAANLVPALLRRVGLDQDVTIHQELLEDHDLSQAQKDARYIKTSAFAEVSRDDKRQIVQQLQGAGRIVAATGDGANDVSAFRVADVAIAVEGSSERAQKAADIVFLKAGLSSIVLAAQMCRQILERLMIALVWRTVLSSSLIFQILWLYAAYGELFDSTLILMIILCYDMVDMNSDNGERSTKCPKSPLKWDTGKIWATVLLLAGILNTGAVTSLLVCNSLGDGAIDQPMARQQVVFLHTVLTVSFLPFLMRTGGRVWEQSGAWRNLGVILGVSGLATLSCIFGRIAPDHPLDVTLAGSTWLGGLSTVVVIASYVALTAEEKCDVMSSEDVKDASSE